jgi:hypothetical protein
MPLATYFTDALEAWSTLAAAIGTIAAVVIVLYRDSWRASRRRPHLTLEFAEQLKAAHPGGMSGSIRGILFGVTLRVRNAAGRDTAHDVEVLASAWWELSPGEWHQQLDLRPLPWSDDYASGKDNTRTTLPPGVARQVEFLRFGRPADLWGVLMGRWRAVEFPPEAEEAAEEGDNPDDAYSGSEVALIVAPPFDSTSRHLVHSHLTHRIRLVVTARDVDAVTYDALLRASAELSPDGDIAFSASWSGGLRRTAGPDAPHAYRSLPAQD